MKKQLLVYYISYLLFFLLISLARRWTTVAFLPFWVGGAIGAILPDVDHLIYIYFLKPHELTSQRATRMLSKGEVLATLSLLANTRSERKQLIFHTALFQIIFYVFVFFVITSSSSLLGRGIVLAFSLHLLIDQFIDFQQLGNISHWLKNLNISLDHEKTVFYWISCGVILILFGFVF